MKDFYAVAYFFGKEIYQQVKVPIGLISDNWGGASAEAWMKREVKIPVDAVGQDLTLYLSTIDDEDITWFNGVGVGKTSGYDQQRKYTIPAKLVKSGSNMITIRISDYFGGGGIGSNGIFRIEGKAPALAAMGGWLYSFPLEGVWSYKVSSEFKGLADKPFPSGLRPENHSPTLIYNAMIAPWLLLRSRGVIWYQGETNGDANAGYEYRTLFPDLIANWGQGDFPFLFVQLANYRKVDKKPKERAWAERR